MLEEEVSAGLVEAGGTGCLLFKSAAAAKKVLEKAVSAGLVEAGRTGCLLFKAHLWGGQPHNSGSSCQKPWRWRLWYARDA